MIHTGHQRGYTLFATLALLLLLGCGGSRTTTTATAELPFKKLVTNAEIESRAGNYVAAADYFRRAYNVKPKRKDLLYKSAELSTRVRDYRAAADAYQFLEGDASDYPLVGLYYGRALRQDGRYDQARSVLTRFRQSYNGGDRPIVNEIVRNELAGIELVRARAGEPATVTLNHPGRGINTRANEYGPVALAGDQLLFSSNAGGQARLYQSQLRGSEWTKATVPPGFPVIAEGEFGTGSSSPDGRVFYFTICSGLTGTDASNRCEIFRGERSLSGAWSQPERLGESINLAGTNNAYPAICITDGREILLFASDREGGRGGMDVYITSRPLNSPLNSFTEPANLGSTVNTVSDEITPYYDDRNNLLYFASNGHPGYGGLDVFTSSGALVSWSPPVNLGQPVNSTADDYGLSVAPNGTQAYLTSNRNYPGVKDNTTETDIFGLNLAAGRARLKANVYDNTTGRELGGIEVTLYEVEDNGQNREIAQKLFPGGVYDFDLQPGSTYRVVVRREGYQGVEYRVATEENTTALYGQPVFLLRGKDDLPKPKTEYPSMELPERNYPEQQQPQAPPQPQPTPSAVRPDPAPASPPTVAFRVQVSAQKTFDPDEGKYEGIRAVGELRAEPIPGRNLQRITVGYYTNEAAAKAGLSRVQTSGFPSAFLVRYDAGVRYGRVNLR